MEWKDGVACLLWRVKLTPSFTFLLLSYNPWYGQAALKIRDEEEGTTARSSPAVVAEESKAKPAMVAGQDAAAAPVLTCVQPASVLAK